MASVPLSHSGGRRSSLLAASSAESSETATGTTTGFVGHQSQQSPLASSVADKKTEANTTANRKRRQGKQKAGGNYAKSRLKADSPQSSSVDLILPHSKVLLGGADGGDSSEHASVLTGALSDEHQSSGSRTLVAHEVYLDDEDDDASETVTNSFDYGPKASSGNVCIDRLCYTTGCVKFRSRITSSKQWRYIQKRIRKTWWYVLAILLLVIAAAAITTVSFLASENAEKFSLDAAVVTDHEQCSSIGAAMLRDGGNAIDAAVAAAICCGVIDPFGCGFGGGAQILVSLNISRAAWSHRRQSASDNVGEEGSGEKDDKSYFSSSQGFFANAVDSFDAECAAPQGSSPTMFDSFWHNRSRGERPRIELFSQVPSSLSVAVPGMLFGLFEAHSHYGSLSWGTVLQPSIDLARFGFVLDTLSHEHLQEHVDFLTDANNPLSDVFAPLSMDSDSGDTTSSSGKNDSVSVNSSTTTQPATSRVPRQLAQVGAVLRAPVLADTLEALKETISPLYSSSGTISEKLASDIASANGLLTAEDLAAYRVDRKPPVVSHFQGSTIISLPPPSVVGAAVSMALNMLEPQQNDVDEVGSVRKLHWAVEAVKMALAWSSSMSDPRFDARVPSEILANVGYDARFNAFDARKSRVEQQSLPVVDGVPLDSLQACTALQAVLQELDSENAASSALNSLCRPSEDVGALLSLLLSKERASWLRRNVSDDRFRPLYASYPGDFERANGSSDASSSEKMPFSDRGGGVRGGGGFPSDVNFLDGQLPSAATEYARDTAYYPPPLRVVGPVVRQDSRSSAIVVIDGDRSAVAVHLSISCPDSTAPLFYSASTGLLLNNRMLAFPTLAQRALRGVPVDEESDGAQQPVSQQTSNNEVAAGKRPPSLAGATIVQRDGAVRLALAAAGSVLHRLKLPRSVAFDLFARDENSVFAEGLLSGSGALQNGDVDILDGAPISAVVQVLLKAMDSVETSSGVSLPAAVQSSRWHPSLHDASLFSPFAEFVRTSESSAKKHWNDGSSSAFKSDLAVLPAHVDVTTVLGEPGMSLTTASDLSRKGHSLYVPGPLFKGEEQHALCSVHLIGVTTDTNIVVPAADPRSGGVVK